LGLIEHLEALYPFPFTKMKKLLLSLALAGAASAQAKMYYFKDLSADFPSQPTVKAYNDGDTAYAVFPNNSSSMLSVIHYLNVTLTVDERVAFHCGVANATSKSYETARGTFQGYPTLLIKSVRNNEYVECLFIFVNDSTFMISSLSKISQDIADHNLVNLLKSLELKAPAPTEVRPAIPVSDDAHEI
jgi:hypothetical protein